MSKDSSRSVRLAIWVIGGPAGTATVLRAFLHGLLGCLTFPVFFPEAKMFVAAIWYPLYLFYGILATYRLQPFPGPAFI